MKPTLDLDSMDELEQMWRDIKTLPEGPQKQRALDAAYRVQARVQEKFDLPVHPIAPDAHLLGIADWGTGLARTAVGEAALMGKAAYDKVTKGKANWSPGAAADRLTSAIIPVGEPATASGDYLRMLGVPEGAHLSDTALGKKLGIDRGTRWDVTGRGAAGFALDMGLTPKNLAKTMEGRPPVELPQTAEQLQKAAKDAFEYERGAPPEPLLPSVEFNQMKGDYLPKVSVEPGRALPAAGGTLKSWVKDPLKDLGELLYRGRFSAADEAARAKGMKLPSDVMLEHGAPGFTSKGVKKGMRSIITQEERAIDALNTPEELGFMPRRPRGQFLAPLESSDTQLRLQTPGSSIATEAAINDIRDQFEHAARQNPAEMRAWEAAREQAGHPMVHPDTGELLYRAGAEQQVLPGVPRVTQNSGWRAQEVPATAPGLEKVVDVPAKPGGMKWVELPDGKRVLQPFPPTEPTYKMVPKDRNYLSREQVWEERPPTVEPGRDVTTTQGELATYPAPADKLIDFSNPDVQWAEARRIRRNFQTQARDEGWYSRRDILEPGARAKADAMAAMKNEIANRAGELEMSMLDEAKPGLGGEVYRRHQNIASLMEGAPYLDREWTGGGPTRATTGGARAISPLQTYARDAALGAMGLAQTVGGKTLMNPWVRYGVAPAARSMWLNDYWQRQAEETPQNPYALIYDYERKR